jgi:hypothetical protein
MSVLPLRLLGLLLLTLAIVIPGCQAVFPLNGATAPTFDRGSQQQ